MDIKKIYFDMDGVLADFDGGVEKLCGIPRANQDVKDEARDTKLWAGVKMIPHFYDKLEPLEDGMKLFNTLYEQYGDRCEILTGIPKPHRGIETAGEDKKSWCKRLLPQGIKVNIVYKEQKKEFCKGKDCILIDDLKANIKDWECSGGSGVLYIGYVDAMSKVEEVVNLI